MIQIFFAFLGGILTIAAPCILPILPILLGSSVGQNSKSRPLLIVVGFTATFALAGLALAAITNYVPFFNPNNVRTIAIILMAVFGVFLIWPRPFEKLTEYFNGTTNELTKKASNNGNALALGMVLGLVWAPCAGPILAAILALVAAQGNTAHSALLLFAYALGAGIPMLIIGYGSQYITTKIRRINRYSIQIQQAFGILIVLFAAIMYTGYDVQIENHLVNLFPKNTLENKLVADKVKTMGIDFENYGQAPDFTNISNWLNSNPLTLQDLRGKVVLVDFWTYSCINCIRTLPHVTTWYDTYKDKGLVIIGVHTPEFAFEKVTDNVKAAIQRYNITYPVAQDNDYGTWHAYNNIYWPAEYLIDQQGNIVYTHFGEGNYENTENAIRTLLGLDGSLNADTNTFTDVESPEMYFGTNRLKNLAPEQSPSLTPTTYSLPQKLALNHFALEGKWQFDGEKARLTEGSGTVRLRFSSGKVFMVASADNPITIHIKVDGKPQANMTVSASQLYTLFDSYDYKEHIIEIQVAEAGFNAFTFTFG